jgi:carbamoyltransferase
METKMKIAGVWSGHDCSYCIMENGKPVVHDEYERFIREKEPPGDAIDFLMKNYDKFDEIDHLATCYPVSKMTHYDESYQKMVEIIKKNGGKIHVVGHHQAHAANAYFSSNLDDALILTVDGGGVEHNNMTTACTVWKGSGNKIENLAIFPMRTINFGGIWTRTTRYVFGLQSGWPYGHQAGSVMAMAAMGNPERFHEDFLRMLTVDNQMASHKPANQPKGPRVEGEDPEHPYLYKYTKIAENSEQDKFDLAAGLQSATEVLFRQLLQSILSKIDLKNLCISGGVSLNSVMMGKIKEWFPHLENVYIPPTPHDGGLTLGAAQLVWHQVLDNERIDWSDNFTPYLGKSYSSEEIESAVNEVDDKVSIRDSNDDEIVDLLSDGNIVAVFGGGSESGRRALGNRSILADPRDPEMKDKINEKVKHRQWYRPFAPSIIEEESENWFENSQSSPYMGFVLKFKEEAKEKVPAVVHFDGSARLQTVSKNDNPWYHNFLSSWNKKSGVPILLNTSFNDREPICENPGHALGCYLRTNIDYLYFYDAGKLVSKK